VVMASEVGVLDIAPERVLEKGGSSPVASSWWTPPRADRGRRGAEGADRPDPPWRAWLDEHLVRLNELPPPPQVHEPDHETVLRRQEVFGYTSED